MYVGMHILKFPLRGNTDAKDQYNIDIVINKQIFWRISFMRYICPGTNFKYAPLLEEFHNICRTGCRSGKSVFRHIWSSYVFKAMSFRCYWQLLPHWRILVCKHFHLQIRSCALSVL